MGIELFTAPTPNGYKASVTLEELGLQYDVNVIDLLSNQQKSPDYIRINPNGRIPTIIDRDENDFAVFESGAIMIYLAEKAGRLLPTRPKARSEVLQWLMFQMGGVGPMMGQANVFHRYFPERLPSVVNRYQNEVGRLFGVLDAQLSRNEYLVNEYSIADIANWCWVRSYAWSGVELDEYPNLRRWHDEIGKRPPAQRGVQVPFDTVALLATEQGRRAFLDGARNVVDSGK
ncbi:MAG: glutathione S-transferase N-terminal domain-containing protein [Myxococcota bacterium]